MPSYDEEKRRKGDGGLFWRDESAMFLEQTPKPRRIRGQENPESGFDI